MTVHSSPYATLIYCKLGFQNIDTEQVVNGVRFTPMQLKSFGGVKMNRKVLKVMIPLLLGMIGIMAYIGYFIFKDSTNNIAFAMCILLPPLSFLSGIVMSILTRKDRKINNTIWLSGFVICLVGTLLYALLILLLICAALAIREL